MKLENIKTISDLVEYELGYWPISKERVFNDDFMDDSRIHNWRRYIPQEFKDIWQELPKDVRLVMYMMAEIESDREEWD